MNQPTDIVKPSELKHNDYSQEQPIEAEHQGSYSPQPTILTPPVNEYDHIFGPQNAPITLVQYGGFDCPHCRRIYSVLKARERRLGDRLCFVFRHFPAPDSDEAQLAAEAAEAAGAQGKFWEMHDRIFEDAPRIIDKAYLVKVAEKIGLAVERFQQELDNRVYADRVKSDYESGLLSGVNGSPTFFVNGKRHDDPWDFYTVVEAAEQPLAVRIRTLFVRFTSLAASGGLVLLFNAILAIIWANSPWGESYFQLWETELAIEIGPYVLAQHLLHWVNDGLMVIFFFIVGLEIKREVISGELASPKRAALPLTGALGGMIFPAAIYALFNAGTPAEPGWGIPMATDIAFTLGVLALLGSRVPVALKVFFAALAIADDLGAILVIAVFYTTNISLIALGFAAIILLMLVLLNNIKVYSPLPYAALGILLWLAFLQSGVHATIAGVLLAMTIPSRSPINIRPLLVQVQSIVDDFRLPGSWQSQVESKRLATTGLLERIMNKMQSPAQRIEHQLTLWSLFFILPIFALANAGVELNFEAATNLLGPVSLGIILGLVLGKPIGITIFCWITVKIGLAEMPEGIGWKQFFFASWLAGIGFTMSLFIASAAFSDPHILDTAKIAVFVASIFAGVVGTVFYRALTPAPEAAKQEVFTVSH